MKNNEGVTSYSELVSVLNTHIGHYEQGKPIISDSEYDGMLLRLREIESKMSTDRIDPMSPTQRGGSVVGSEELSHRMYSLKDVFNVEELRKWVIKMHKAGAREFVCEPKYDGMASEMTWVKGELVKATRRGDGVKGDHIDLGLYRNIKPRIGSFTGVEHGETIIPKARLPELKEKFGVEHLRNVIASLAVNYDANKAEVAAPTFIPYRLFEESNEKIKSILDESKRSSEISMTCWERAFVSDENINELMNKLSNYILYITGIREDIPYELDGVVIKVNEHSLHESIGWRKDTPRWACAYKFADPSTRTTVEDIKYTVGETGLIAVTVYTRPVSLNGINLNKFHVGGTGKLCEMGICKGTSVSVVRRGGTKPMITEVHDPSRVKVISHCPCCNTVLRASGRHSFCTNDSCPDRVKTWILNTAKFNGIKPFGPASAGTLYDRCGVTKIQTNTESDELTFIACFGTETGRSLYSLFSNLK